ncbi:hypothetical protein CROQUDRAFT_134964 [Cronartium quercuum f. sp. fusiforme G11]|uniref:SH3 domain-containing protein n=1 Tax=Cronartium quercuum f. sp. fusiforme G11 TaxID=708437 RepID=A0A9P6NDA4_9BASI|nr:hypothetical protein CROQUDRAFT_134964 [Cronartium quercuum f. sp. fusiforme G11]
MNPASASAPASTTAPAPAPAPVPKPIRDRPQMTTLFSQFARIPSNPTPNSPGQPPPSSGSSTRFSLSLPIDPSSHPLPSSPSLFSALLSPSNTKTTTITTTAAVPTRPTANLTKPPAPLPRPRALSSSHLPPPFPSPSGAFLPPPSSHWLPLVLPPACHRKKPTQPTTREPEPNPAPPSTRSRRRSHSQSLLCEPEFGGRVSNASSLAEHAHRRSAPPIASSIALPPSLTTSTVTVQSGGIIRIRDFGFASDDPRHTGILTPSSQPSERVPKMVEEDEELRAERSASYLCMPSSEGPILWTTMPTTPTRMREDQDSSEGGDGEIELDSDDGLDSEDGLREEIERRRESLDKSLQSIGRPSIGSVVDDTDEEEFEGLWVALYGFEAEGESEMGLVEGEVVRVVRAVCDGWVVARKVPGELDEAGNFIERVLDGQEMVEGEQVDEGDQMGLCPQNYLARI